MKIALTIPILHEGFLQAHSHSASCLQALKAVSSHSSPICQPHKSLIGLGQVVPAENPIMSWLGLTPYLRTIPTKSCLHESGQASQYDDKQT
jgi:hypothetical protein